MTAIERKTNADVIEPFVSRIKGDLQVGLTHFKEHPDELAVGMAPTVLLMLATTRHKLNVAEWLVISQCGYWCGALAMHAYQEWKAQDVATPLRRVK